MARTILITGAAGSIGKKLRAHFEAKGGYDLRLLDRHDGGDAAVRVADLALWDDGWVDQFKGVDAVIHLAGNPRPEAPWASIQRDNIDLVLNVYEAAVRQGAKRLIFASSNWTMAATASPTVPCRPIGSPIRSIPMASRSSSASVSAAPTATAGASP